MQPYVKDTEYKVTRRNLHDNHVDPSVPLAADRYEQLVVVVVAGVEEGVQFVVVEVPVPHMVHDNHVGSVVVVVVVDMSALLIY